MKPLLLPLTGNEAFRHALAVGLEAEVGETNLRRFPDGETYVRINSPVKGRTVILLCSLDHPDEKTLPLYLIAKTAQDLGASQVGLVAPYLPYMRQDARFQPGEGITSRYYAAWLSGFVDWLVTVDPHLHRYGSLNEIYSIPTGIAPAASSISRWIQANLSNPFLIGPDRESEQWVAEVALGAKAPFVVLEKKRKGDLEVDIEFPSLEAWRGLTPVLVDDIISSGHTMVQVIRHLKEKGFASPTCIAVHALFALGSYEDLLSAGAAQIVTCNTISHPSNGIDVSDPLIGQVRKMGFTG